MTKRIFLILIVAFCAGPVIAQSEAGLDSLSNPFQIEEVEVTARALTKDVIVPQTLQGAELQRLNALSVADALRYFSGVQIKDYGGVGGIKTINIRSMGSQHTAVYYNGVQLGNAQNGQVDLGRFSLDNMEEIQLYNGQKSDIFQSAREFGAAGNVYLTTRRPYFKTHERVHVRGQMRFGSFALANPNVGVDIKLTDELSMTLDAGYVYSDGKYRFRYKRVLPNGETAYDTTAVRQNGDINAVRAELGLHDFYSTTGFFRLHAYHYWSERGIPGAIVNNVWRNGERLWDRNTFVQAEWKDEWFNRWSTRVLAKLANDYTHYQNYDERLLPSNNEYVQQEAYVSFANKVEVFNWWDVSVAYDYQYNALERENLLLEAGPEYFQRHSHWLSAATAFNIKEYLRIQASVLMTAVSQEPRAKSQEPKVTPGVFLSFRPLAFSHSPFADLSFNAFYKQSYRYPTFNDLYYTDLGNANLRPELARQHSVELSYTCKFSLSSVSPKDGLSSVSAAVSYYYNRVTDKIIAYPKGQQFRWTMLNLGTVKINGADVNADVSLFLPLNFTLRTRLKYTYQKAIDVTNPNDTYYGDQIPYIPLHSGSVVLGLDWQSRRGDHYGFNYSFIYVGERYSQQENSIYNYVQPWYTHDLSLYGEWSITNHQSPVTNPIWLKANIEINNLLGQDYEVIQNYPMPKQNVRCTLAVRY
ncbi:MAG: TonB-dependent receptor plug domain-containing protein [Paludibacteraceae bacterium]|nr:TonB-dependent receptor plug domain-containing protein [Paludibacteraceae bacterium]